MTTVGRWSPNKVRKRILDNTWRNADTLGIRLLIPSSVAAVGTGSSATINTNGSITYSSAHTIRVNGVFSATYDNYMIVVRGTENGAYSYRMRLRASGTDDTTANSYVSQGLQISGTTEAGDRVTGENWYMAWADNTSKSGFTTYIYGPYLAQATAYRTTTVNDLAGARIYDHAGTHNQATSYDGFTLYDNTGLRSLGGRIAVYGMVK